MVDEFVKQAVILVIVTSCLPLAVCSAASLVFAVVQTATQIQEQTFSYLLKFVSIAVVLFYCSGWFFSEYIRFFEISLSSLKVLGTAR